MTIKNVTKASSTEANLRISKVLRDRLKMIAAMRGQALVVLTEEVLTAFVASVQLPTSMRMRPTGK